VQLPAELFEEHEEDDLRLALGVRKPVPVGQEEFYSRYRRFKRCVT
jgi:hypothetical protein